MSIKKPRLVTRKFLNALADKIYDPKTRRYLRLCTGKLVNGPDPRNPERRMHCGLGELYFAITGTQPDLERVDEGDVVELAFERSTLSGLNPLESVVARLEKLGIPQATFDRAKTAIEESAEDLETDFKNVLNEIPGVNDSCDDGLCKKDQVRRRSMRVASKLREAAQLLPK